MKVKYTGSKRCKVPVLFPIGIKSMSGVAKVVYIDPTIDPEIDLDSEDAIGLVRLDPSNFSFGSINCPSGLELDPDRAPISPIKIQKKRGRKPKAKLEEVAVA